MVFAVNMALDMGKGKIAAQCCHACLGAFKRAPAKYVRPWARSGQPKIALKCKDLQELMAVATRARKYWLCVERPCATLSHGCAGVRWRALTCADMR